MKILQLGKFYPVRGGVEKVMYDLTVGLSSEGIDCDMMCASADGPHMEKRLNDRAALYSAADVFVNPTWQDNYPTVNLEAISCGTPVVTYRTGGSPESVAPGTGYVVAPGDISGILDAVRLIGDAGKTGYSEACRRHALANFRKEDRYADYLELYDGLVSVKH